MVILATWWAGGMQGANAMEGWEAGKGRPGIGQEEVAGERDGEGLSKSQKLYVHSDSDQESEKEQVCKQLQGLREEGKGKVRRRINGKQQPTKRRLRGKQAPAGRQKEEEDGAEEEKVEEEGKSKVK